MQPGGKVGFVLSGLAFLTTWLVAKRSFTRGLGSCLAVGYMFGIVRANLPETASYFIFDAAVLGLYCGQLPQVLRRSDTHNSRYLKHWIALLVVWPLVLFFIPQQDYLVQLVGLRGNIFLLPFVLMGSQLRHEESYDLALWLSTLNAVAVFVAVAEFSIGLGQFFPQNQITYMIFHSSDVGSGSFRIPSTFSNAHSFGGMMVLSVPWIAGAWTQNRGTSWQKYLLLTGLVAAVLGVLMSAARVDFIILALIITVLTFSGHLKARYRIAWLIALAAIACLVVSNDRLQRFTTLDDPTVLTTRLSWGLNASLVEAIADHPFGVGLGGGGTSMPSFLENRVERPVLLESEVGRIELETGLVGLACWLAFVCWVFTRRDSARIDPWRLGKLLARYSCLAFVLTGFIGTGLMTAIPSSAVLLMTLGWLANPMVQTAPRLASDRAEFHRPATALLSRAQGAGS